MSTQKLQFFVLKNQQWCRHSSVDSSAPTILPPQVRVPSTPSMLFSLIVFVLSLSCEKNKNKLKEAGFGPFLKKTSNAIKFVLSINLLMAVWSVNAVSGGAELEAKNILLFWEGQNHLKILLNHLRKSKTNCILVLPSFVSSYVWGPHYKSYTGE